ncbi:valine--tRNA ligase [Candidatus Liberibacter africanus]|uniref:Valine--tRNA ligase n=1 Tax=Candidatus Liberibacter africanus PTSAPSY TaxID=1277257 RepID=A0A0G3I3P5_LIBAF|nr:valine--tRNA ligase [Candidatus Liberibacter africanus]AKK20474.1 valyl-tRNA synthetase [Candidatus Liberibacter africanus PTSAPSY]QTP64189.1 valine--tRNA ligase [Candidatus Liberibacter africanus]
MIDKTYDFSLVERKSADKWHSIDAFRMGANASLNSESFCIVMPPPNVTGSLHMGHAFNSTIQDIIIRFERMRGKNVLWQPGMDHAGIATQITVESRLLCESSLTREDIGRQAFIEKIWDWKEKSGGFILSQLKRLGASCDWSRERFTMDQGMSQAVISAFVILYKDGLIYRDNRISNWDPHLKTSVSDLEVIQDEVDGSLWYIRYPLVDGVTYCHPITFDNDGIPIDWEVRDYIIVSTTRPETMFGDVGIVIHPDDCRYKDLVGKYAKIPIVDRIIPIICDSDPDPEFGSGVVKITPAHDFNDFEVAKRHGLDFINILTPEAKIFLLRNESFLKDLVISDEIRDILNEFEGLDCLTARSKIVSFLEKINLLDEVKSYRHVVPRCERSGVIIEPRITEQWYLDAKVLAESAILSVRSSRTSFIPQSWDKSYYEWLENIQPWCISRQIWWGHQIPVWYGPDGKVFVENTEDVALRSAIDYYLAQNNDMTLNVQKMIQEGNVSKLLKREEDVLDTWFSSALWPFASLGWPEKTTELKTYYPTNIVVTGFDILFFWVARMMMMGLYFMKDTEGKGIEPFQIVYMHALIRDKNGQKMSKSKGNVIDPIDLIDQYGADALRFYFSIMAVQGRDIKLDLERIIGYRNFVTKFWNAVRFAKMKDAKHSVSFIPQNVEWIINKWIIARLAAVINEVTIGIENRRFNDVSAILYRFVWNELCDWYVEFIKSILNQEDNRFVSETLSCFSYVLCNVCKLLHPIIPFVTEELYAHVSPYDDMKKSGFLCHAQWPSLSFYEPASVEEVNWVIRLISEVRSVRTEINVPLKAVVPLVFVNIDPVMRERLMFHKHIIDRLSSGNIIFADSPPDHSIQIILDGMVFFLQIGDFIDFVKEKHRLEKSLEKVIKELSSIRKRLDNNCFVEKAPPEVLQLEKEKLSKVQKKKLSIEISLERIKIF